MNLNNFVGETYDLDSRVSGVARTINLIPVPQEPGNERTAWVFKDIPGLVSFNATSGAIRNTFTFRGVLHAVRDDKLISVDSNGVATVLATLLSAGGVVDMNQTLTQLVISDGTNLYSWNGTSLTTVSTFQIGGSLAFIDQRIVFPIDNTQSFQWSDLGDATSLNPLNFASAEGSPDELIAVLAVNRELLLYGEGTTEVWHSVDPPTTFARSVSEYLQVGLAAPRSAVVVGDTPIWLGQDVDGQAQVMGGRGVRISNRSIEERFEGLALESARAFTWSWQAHQFYCLNVPNVDTTLVYDLTFKRWFEFAELVGGMYAQWRPTCHAFAYDNHFFGTDTGGIFKLDATVNNFAGSVKCRDRISPVISSPDMHRLRFPELQILADRGTNGTVMMRHSNDNGSTWNNWHYDSAGATGKYRERMLFRRLGSARDRVFQVRMTDDAPWNPNAMNLEVR